MVEIWTGRTQSCQGRQLDSLHGDMGETEALSMRMHKPLEF